MINISIITSLLIAFSFLPHSRMDRFRIHSKFAEDIGVLGILQSGRSATTIGDLKKKLPPVNLSDTTTRSEFERSGVAVTGYLKSFRSNSIEYVLTVEDNNGQWIEAIVPIPDRTLRLQNPELASLLIEARERSVSTVARLSTGQNRIRIAGFPFWTHRSKSNGSPPVLTICPLLNITRATHG